MDYPEFMSGKELIGFKSVSKSAQSAVKREKGSIFDVIKEQLREIINECQLRSVPKKHKFKLKSWVMI